jgi:hydroxymethylpyrimidine pyrophosphatase-like HAD family hydrolase
MGNATEELHALASVRGWRIGPTNCEDGVAVMLEEAVAMLGVVSPVSSGSSGRV